MTKEEMVRYWINKANDEIETASIMYQSSKFLYTGFMCHQCIEKSMKAFYIYEKDERQPYEHNLNKLAKAAGLYDRLDDTHKHTIEKLNPLYISTRYDDYKNAIDAVLTKDYCKSLLSETEVLLKWILQLMK